MKHIKYALPAVCLFHLTSFASGLSKPVLVGPKAIGMGGAFMGVANDTTAIFHNPAGITQLEGYNVYVGMDGLITDLTYTPPNTGVAEEAKTEFLPVPSVAFTTDVLKHVTVGLGIFFPHGNGGTFESASGFPGNPNEGRIYSMEITPSVAYELIDNFSIGASFRAIRGSSSLKGQILPAPLSDTLDDLDVNGWGFAFAAGLFYKPFPQISFGANYRSKAEFTLEGDARLQTLGNFGASLEQIFPSQVTGGIGLYPIEGLTIGLGYSYERNSEIKSFNATLLSTPNVPLTLVQNWSDSHTIHIGAEYWFHPMWAGRAGYARDLFASIPDNAMNRIVGDIAAQEVSVGVACLLKSRYEIGLTWNGRFGERTIPFNGLSNPGPGTYDAFIHSVSVGASARL